MDAIKVNKIEDKKQPRINDRKYRIRTVWLILVTLYSILDILMECIFHSNPSLLRV